MPGNEPLQSVMRALHALELVGNCPEGLALYHIAGGLGVRRQTAHHIVRTLLHEGFVEKVGSPPRYRLAEVMSSLQRRQSAWNRGVLVRATPIAIRLARATKAEVVIGQYVGTEVVGRLVVPGDPCTAPWFAFGWRCMHYGTALGYVAFMGDEAIKDYVARHGFSEDDRLYWQSPGLLSECIARVRSEGYLAMIKGDNFRAAAPVFDAPGSPVGLISAVKPAASLLLGEAGRCVRLVRQAADSLTASLLLIAAAQARGDHNSPRASRQLS